MPELIEVEQYRRALDPLIGRRLHRVEILHPEFVRPRGAPAEVFAVAEGARLHATRRQGKVLLLDLAVNSVTLVFGLRFGMTGMLVVDGAGPIDRLEYASGRKDPAWDRLRMLVGDSTVTVRDQRRLGSVELDPDLRTLGPDALEASAEVLHAVLEPTRRALKTVLLDQSRVSGLGNLLTDEILWRASLSPHTPAAELDETQIAHLASTIQRVLTELTQRGGSHMGDSFTHRVAGARCPACGGTMKHSRIGGRSTWWCSDHQQ